MAETSPPRTILITGASRGLGRALTEAYAQAGHRLAATVRREKDATALQEAARAKLLVGLADVSDGKALEEFARRVESHWGTPDLVLANAGFLPGPGPFLEQDEATWRKSLEANVMGTVNLFRACLPGMLKAGRGTLVAFSSGAGVRGFPGLTGYCASKFALEGLVQALAAELPEPLAAVAFQPGTIDTDMLRTNWGEERSREQPTPAEWAQVAAPYLLRLGREENGQSRRLGPVKRD